MTKGDAHMIDSGFIRFGAVSALVGVLLLASSPGVHASSAGVVKASPRVVAQMVKDMGSTQPAKCQFGSRAFRPLMGRVLTCEPAASRMLGV